MLNALQLQFTPALSCVTAADPAAGPHMTPMLGLGLLSASWLPAVLIGAGLLLLVGMLLRGPIQRVLERMGRERGTGRGVETTPDLRARLQALHRRVSPVAPLPPPLPRDPVAADLEELGQNLVAELDARAARLESLLAEADARIGQLEQLAQRPTPRTPARPAPGPIYASMQTPAEDQPDPLNWQIYQMADQGLPAVEIARHLKQHVGNVQLVLALRRS